MKIAANGWPFALGTLAALGAACGSKSTSPAPANAATGVLALHGAYGPVAGATSARFSALTFVTATTYSAVPATCTQKKCREDGTYVFDGAHDLALTDGATNTTTHIALAATATAAASATASDGGSGSSTAHALHPLDGLVAGAGGGGSLVTAGGSLLPTITAATFDGAGMQHVDDDDPPAPSTGPLVIPLTSNPGTASIFLQVGKNGPVVPALLDTGSVGIWIAPGILADGDGIDQQQQISQTYGGKQALTAEVRSAYVRLEGPTPNATTKSPQTGTVFRTNGLIPVAVVTSASCVGSAPCDDGSSASGLSAIKLAGTNFQAVVGIGLNRNTNLDGVITPFAGMGQQSEQFVLHIGPSGNSGATLVIDPSASTLARFATSSISLAPVNGNSALGFDSKSIPFCVNQYCVTGALDSGETNGLFIDTGAASQYDQMGIPAPGTLPTKGIVVGSADGQTADAALQVTVDGVSAFSVSPGDTIVPGASEMVVRPNVAQNNLGILPFRALDVFFDGWNGVAGVAPLATTPSPASTPSLLPSAYRGVMTRYGIGADPSDFSDLGISGNPKGNPPRYTVSPDLAGEELATWIHELESQGVNLGTVNLDPVSILDAKQVPTIDAADWNDFLGLMATSETTTPSQANIDFINGIRTQLAAANYTSQERNEAQLNFLQRLENLSQQGVIDDGVRFIVDQRLWFGLYAEKTGILSSPSAAKRVSLEAQFATDIAGFINQAVARGLDHWLAGFRLEEHANIDMGFVLPVFVDLATLINSQTNGWLGSHTMIGAGGGWGPHFTGVNTVKCPADAGPGNTSYQFSCNPGSDFDFFGLISQQAGAFAFGYKFFEYTNPVVYSQPPFNGVAVTGMNGAMAKYCSLGGTCDGMNLTAQDWETFLEDDQGGLGLSDLASLVNANAAQYPNYANVLFIGDSQDGIFDMVSLSAAPASSDAGTADCGAATPPPKVACAPGQDSCALAGLSQAFAKGAAGGGNWTGKIYLDGHDSTSNFSCKISNLVLDGVTDIGRFMFQVDYDAVTFTPLSPVSTLQPSTAQYWSCWPALPPCNP